MDSFGGDLSNEWVSSFMSLFILFTESGSLDDTGSKLSKSGNATALTSSHSGLRRPCGEIGEFKLDDPSEVEEAE